MGGRVSGGWIPAIGGESVHLGITQAHRRSPAFVWAAGGRDVTLVVTRRSLPMGRLLSAGIVVALVRTIPVAQGAAPLPNRPGSLKFAAIGDNGTGEQPQYDVARQMDQWHQRFPFDMVIMLGDNLYGSQQPADFVRKFERPYKPLLDAGVKFYASLGNHDHRSNDEYLLFNMHGERYYTYVRNDVRFLVLDSNALDPPQLAWLEKTLQAAKERWKIAYFHHPLYS